MKQLSDAEKEGQAARLRPTTPPRWVKVFAAVALLLVVLFVALHLGGHGFGAHAHG